MQEDIETLIVEIVTTYIDEGYSVDVIPVNVCDIANKYGIDLNKCYKE